MRKWKGIHVGDKILYNNKEYIVEELYIEKDESMCSLLNVEENERLKNIIISECIKIEE